jgi:hypothetical protein
LPSHLDAAFCLLTRFSFKETLIVLPYVHLRTARTITYLLLQKTSPVRQPLHIVIHRE